jgi:hypothetical protein
MAWRSGGELGDGTAALLGSSVPSGREKKTEEKTDMVA